MNKRLFYFAILITITLLISSCSKEEKKSDAYGNFEAVETIVSSESNGKLQVFDVEEGMELEAGVIVGYIDTAQLTIKKQQLYSQKRAISTRTGTINAQVNVIREQINVAMIEKKRVENLLKDNAASQKQLDDINGNINVLEKQISQIQSQNTTTNAELKTFDSQVLQIDDQIEKSFVKNPLKGTVLMKFAEPNEIVTFGKPLYKIADLNVMELRIFVSGTQLPEIKIGQKVKVLIDNGKDGFKTIEGEISWISSKAEFTPKIIQTKEERVNLVYAVKVRVNNNDGSIKIGMPGEVLFK